MAQAEIMKTFRFQLIYSSVLILCAAILLITLMTFIQYSSSMLRQSEKTTLDSFAVAEKRMDRMLSDAHNAALLIKRAEAVDKYLFQSDQSGPMHVLAERNMLNVISSEMSGNNYLNGIFFFLSDGRTVGTANPWRICYETDGHPFYQNVLQYYELSNNIRWIGGFWQHELIGYVPTSIDSQHIMIVGASQERFNFSYLREPIKVTMLISVSEQVIQDCFDALSDENSQIFLLDSQGRQLSGPEAMHLNEVPGFYFHIPHSDTYSSSIIKLGEEKYHIVYYRMANTGWLIVRLISFETYNSPIRLLILRMSLTSTALLLGMCGIYALWAKRFTHPFRQITHAIEQVQEGNLSVPIRTTMSVYEFELIRTGFNDMIRSISSLLEQTREMEHEHITLELRNLQSQLNPHMVFNSITAIRWMAIMNGADGVSDMLVELAELIRPIYREWRMTWPLRDELAYVGHYTNLLKLRYGTGFEIAVDIPSDMLEQQLPCYTLQPLLENSCEHGARDDRVIRVQLEGTNEDDDIIIRIRDNGRGMSEQMLRSLERSMAINGSDLEEKLGYTGIGLCNIHRRIQIFCGERYGLKLSSVEGEGTCVEVRLRGK